MIVDNGRLLIRDFFGRIHPKEELLNLRIGEAQFCSGRTRFPFECRIRKSIRFCANYFVAGKYHRYATNFGISDFKGFRSPYVTTTTARLGNIRLSVAKLDVPQKAKRFHWITTGTELATQSIFTPIWPSIDPTDDKRYLSGSLLNNPCLVGQSWQSHLKENRF